MTIDIDARGLACPGPVVLTKERLSRSREPFTIFVDNEAARENVSRFAKSNGCGVEVSEKEEGFIIRIVPPEERKHPEETTVGASTAKTTLAFIKSDVLGEGERELGETLMKSFLFACAESENPPGKIVFINSGVRLVTVNEATVEHIKKLENNGIEIIACGTCLDYYRLKESLKVGRIGNMYEIISMLVEADNVISI